VSNDGEWNKHLSPITSDEELLERVSGTKNEAADVFELLRRFAGFPSEQKSPVEKWFYSCLIASIKSGSLDKGFGVKVRAGRPGIDPIKEMLIAENLKSDFVRRHRSEASTGVMNYVSLAEMFGVSVTTIESLAKKYRP
jgi:hypothetical protein